MLSADTLLLAAEEKSGLFLILPAPAELIWGTISFAVLVALIWRFAGPALKRTLDERQQAVAAELDHAETAKTEAQSLLEDYRKQLAEANEEANRVVEDARATAEGIRHESNARATAEAEEIRLRARDEAESEIARAREGLRAEVANLSVDMAERVVQESLDRDAQRNLVERYLEELESTS